MHRMLADSQTVAGVTLPTTDWMLIVISLVIFFLVIAVNGYILVYFQHPEDKNTAWIPKLVVWGGLCLASYGVLLLPLDVANRQSLQQFNQQIPIDTLWQILLMAIVIYILFVYPFATFYYEESDAGIGGQLKSGLTYGFVTLIIGSVLIYILYAAVGWADIPVAAYIARIGYMSCSEKDMCSAATMELLSIKVTLPIYAVGVIAVLGWGFFSVFCGVGLVALPIDMVNSWRWRPKSGTVKMWAIKKQELRERAERLRSIGNQLGTGYDEGNKMTRADKKMFNKFKQAVFFLERDYEELRIAYDEKGGNVLWYFFLGCFGSIGVVVSLLWVMQMVGFIFLNGLYPFLNNVLISLDGVFPLFGTATYGFLAYYLMMCTIKGTFKLGCRIAIFPIHPMKVNGTMMNSFLFNVMLVLLCTIPNIQFCTEAFSIYARVTAVDLLFGTQIKYLRYLSFIWSNNIFLYVMFVFVALTSIYLCLKGPKDKPYDPSEIGGR